MKNVNIKLKDTKHLDEFLAIFGLGLAKLVQNGDLPVWDAESWLFFCSNIILCEKHKSPPSPESLTCAMWYGEELNAVLDVCSSEEISKTFSDMEDWFRKTVRDCVD